MIVTVTLNPSLDRAIEIDHLARGDVLRARSGRLDPGGKGVNVSRALLANGIASRAVLPCGGDEGAQLVRLLAAEGVDLVAVPIGGHTRSNITLAEPDGTVTKVNEPGPSLSAVEFDAVTGQALAAAGTAGWVVVCGSLPPGVTPSAFGRLCRRIVAAGVRLAVDTSGPALRAAAEAGAHLVKPNREELSEVVGHPLPSLADVVDAAHRVRTWGAGAVLASLGADGAILVTGEAVVSGAAAVPAPRSTVGAGDALLAGFLAALTRSGDVAGPVGSLETAGISASTANDPGSTQEPAIDGAGAGGATADGGVKGRGGWGRGSTAPTTTRRSDIGGRAATGTDVAGSADGGNLGTAAGDGAGHGTIGTTDADPGGGAGDRAAGVGERDADVTVASGKTGRPVLMAALAEGLAWGAAAVSLPGSRMPRPEDLRRDAVVIHPDSDIVRVPGSAGTPDSSPTPEGSVR